LFGLSKRLHRERSFVQSPFGQRWHQSSQGDKQASIANGFHPHNGRGLDEPMSRWQQLISILLVVAAVASAVAIDGACVHGMDAVGCEAEQFW